MLRRFRFHLLMLLAILVSRTPAYAFQTGEVLTDPVARLQALLDRGEVALKYDPVQGYLKSVLSLLKIPVSSQALVFSKTSLHSDLISPSTPRALYFNDDVYVSWVQEAAMLEIASVDPRYGTIFYAITQSEGDVPAFKRVTAPCTSCHGPARDDVPAQLLLMLSTEVEATGDSIGEFTVVTDRTPFDKRWGGWYVNAARGDVAHRGNKVILNGAERRLIDPSSTARPFNSFRYLTSTSDVVALMLFGHQVDVHNRINEASLEVKQLGASAQPARVADSVEPLVRSLLFSGAAPFAEPIRGPSEFANEFASTGRKDRRGRSLKDLDLDRRLLRYPLSYLIYSDSFDQMPDLARAYAYRRLWEIFTAKDRSNDFAHLSTADRSALLEILSDTKPEFRTFVEKMSTAER